MSFQPRYRVWKSRIDRSAAPRVGVALAVSVWWTTALRMVAKHGVPDRSDSSAPHSARVTTGGAGTGDGGGPDDLGGAPGAGLRRRPSRSGTPPPGGRPERHGAGGEQAPPQQFAAGHGWAVHPS